MSLILDSLFYFWVTVCTIGGVTLLWKGLVQYRATNRAIAQRLSILFQIEGWPARLWRKKLALKEYSQVTLKDHAKAVRKSGSLYRPTALYGPIIQTLLCGDFSFLADKQWWRCYKEIYLEMGDMGQEQCRFAFYKAQTYGQTSDFFVALNLMSLNGYEILKQIDKDSGKTLMDAGAEEYDEAMRAQELMQ